LLCRRQRRQPVIKLAFDFHISAAILGESIEPFPVFKPVDTGWVFILTSAPRLAHLVHEPFTGSILSIPQFKGVSCGAQARG